MKTKILAPCLMLAFLSYLTTPLSATNDPITESTEMAASEAKYEDLQKKADELLFKIQD